MEVYSQLIWNSLVFGLLSASLAASFSFIYSVSRVLHLVHGAVVVFGGYLLYTFTQTGVPFGPALLFSSAAGGLLGVLVNELVYETMRRRRRVAGAAFMIVSLGGLLVLQNIFLAGWGSRTLRISSPFDGRAPFSALGATIEPLALAIVVSAITLFVLAAVLLRFTRFGVAARAVADHEEMAAVVGVNTRRVRDWTFFLGSSAAGFFGALYGLLVNVFPHQATYNAIDAFSVALVGGLGSLPGSLVAGVSLSLLSNLGGFWLKAVLQNVLVFAGIFVFLLLRPQGLFGFRK